MLSLLSVGLNHRNNWRSRLTERTFPTSRCERWQHLICWNFLVYNLGDACWLPRRSRLAIWKVLKNKNRNFFFCFCFSIFSSRILPRGSADLCRQHFPFRENKLTIVVFFADKLSGFVPWCHATVLQLSDTSLNILDSRGKRNEKE